MRTIAGIGLALIVTLTLGAQVLAPTARVLSARTRTFVSLDGVVADVATADIALFGERSTATDLHRVEAAVLQALAGRRDVILALDAVDRAAQESLEHFQMEHLSADEFLAEAKMPTAAREAYLPLMKIAIARRWPIVATGGARTEDDATIAAPLIQALEIGSVGGKRPLLVSVHAGTSDGVIDGMSKRLVAQSPGRRAVTVQLVAVPSFDDLTPLASAPPAADYVVYTLTTR